MQSLTELRDVPNITVEDCPFNDDAQGTRDFIMDLFHDCCDQKELGNCGLCNKTPNKIEMCAIEFLLSEIDGSCGRCYTLCRELYNECHFGSSQFTY